MVDDNEGEQLPLEARAIHRRLVSDSSHWVRGLPAETSIAEFARAVPHRMPSPSAHQAQNVLAHRRLSSIQPDMMSSKGHTSMFKNQSPWRTFAASIAAVAVVALLVGLLYTMHNMQGARVGSGPGSPTTVTPTPVTPPPTSGNYGTTPGPLAKYVANLYTTGENSSDGTPANVKTRFVVGDFVYTSATLTGLPVGLRTITIRWYVNGVGVDFLAGVETRQIASDQTASDQRLVFSLHPSQPGAYTAKVYIDRLPSDTSESPNDPYLAGTVTFVVEPS